MKKKTIKIFFIITMFLIATKPVLGERKYVYLSEASSPEIGQKIYRNYSGKQSRELFIRIVEHNSDVEEVGYCLDVGKNLKEYGLVQELEGGLEAYLTKILKNNPNTKQIAQRINAYATYGYQYNNQNDYKYQLATQKLIWDELYNEGYRKGDYSADMYFTSGNQTIDITKEINQIKENINNYKKTPSLCSSNTKLELAAGETAKYEDLAGVLSNYKVNCTEGLECKTEGNILEITAKKKTTDQKVTFVKEGIDKGPSIVYERVISQEDVKDGNIYNYSEQAIFVNRPKLEEISCQMGINIFKNEKTSGAKTIALISLAMLTILIANMIINNNKYLSTQK